MSISLMARVWAESKAEGGSLLVMLALADWCNEDGMCWPSIPKLAEKARLSERQTQYVLRGLESQGEISVDRSAGGRNKRSTYYLTCGETVQFAPETMQTVQFAAETVQFATQTVQPTAPALIRQIDPSTEPPEDIYALVSLRGFKESYSAASERVRDKLLAAVKGWDLEVEAVKVADWIDRHRGRKATVAFLLNWFDKPNGGTNGPTRPHPTAPLSQFTRGAGSATPAGRTEAERYAARVTRYQS